MPPAPRWFPKQYPNRSRCGGAVYHGTNIQWARTTMQVQAYLRAVAMSFGVTPQIAAPEFMCRAAPGVTTLATSPRRQSVPSSHGAARRRGVPTSRIATRCAAATPLCRFRGTVGTTGLGGGGTRGTRGERNNSRSSQVARLLLALRCNFLFCPVVLLTFEATRPARGRVARIVARRTGNKHLARSFATRGAGVRRRRKKAIRYL